MAGSPQIPQGTLNRLLASVVVPSFLKLTVTPPFLGKNGISLRFSGEATKFIPTLTGVVTSPEPFQMVELTITLLKTQPLAQLYETQRVTQSLIGNVTVRPDSAVLGPYKLLECAIQNVGDLRFNGEEADYGVMIQGYYPINSSLWI